MAAGSAYGRNIGAPHTAGAVYGGAYGSPHGPASFVAYGAGMQRPGTTRAVDRGAPLLQGGGQAAKDQARARQATRALARATARAAAGDGAGAEAGVQAAVSHADTVQNPTVRGGLIAAIEAARVKIAELLVAFQQSGQGAPSTDTGDGVTVEGSLEVDGEKPAKWPYYVGAAVILAGVAAAVAFTGPKGPRKNPRRGRRSGGSHGRRAGGSRGRR